MFTISERGPDDDDDGGDELGAAAVLNHPHFLPAAPLPRACGCSSAGRSPGFNGSQCDGFTPE